MQKRQVLINAIMSVVQVIVIAGVFFVLYRFLLNTIGVDQLGVWSVVLATTSIASIANLGLSASVVKFVAKYLARNKDETAADVIQTSAISVAIFIGLVLLIAYPFLNRLLMLIIPVGNIKEAISILPYALLSLWIMVIVSVFLAGIDGYQRIDLRSIILMIGMLIYLILCYVLVPTYGLIGLAYAQLAQNCLLLIGSWSILKRLLSFLPIIPYKWNYKLFREMVGYGLNFQIISISQMLYDPITKALLTKFGGLTMTGFYEMASRMILQLRALLVNANQVLIPAIAELHEKNQKIIQKVYKDSYRLLFYIALPIFSAIIAFTPIISQVWIGHYENTFVLFSILLALGWFLNTLTAPAYFVILGTGELLWITIGQVVIAVLNLILGLVLGSIYGGTAVVAAWVLALSIGSFVNPIMYHYRHKISIINLLPKEDIGIVLTSIGGLLILLFLYYHLDGKLNLSLTAAVLILVFFVTIGLPVWLHPMRRHLMRWVTDGLLKKSI